MIGKKLEESWKQPVVIENRPGAGGSLATRQIARGDVTGHAILVTTSAYAVNPTLQTNPGYQPDKDLTAIAIVAVTPNLIVAAPNGPIETMADVAALAKKRPVTYGTAGVGTTPHLSAERIFKLGAGLPISHVPHTGAGPALTSVLGGHIDLASVALSAATELVKGGQVKGLAVTSSKRLQSLPDVPTVAESGFSGGNDATWVAMFVPASTPATVVDKLNADVNAALATPDVQAGLERVGFEAVGGSPAQAREFVGGEIAKWADVVKKLGLRVDP